MRHINQHTNMQKLTALLIALALIWIQCAVGAEETENGTFADSAVVAEGDYTPARLSIRTEEAMRAESGMTLQQWEEELAFQRQAGLNAPVSEEMLAAGENARILRQSGRIYMIQSPVCLEAVTAVPDAVRTVYSLLDMLGGVPDADLKLWSVLTMGEHQVYVFQQVCDGLTVIGSTVKIVTDADGNVNAVFSSLAPALPERTGAEQITRGQAEDIVRMLLTEQGSSDTVLSDYTVQAIIPIEPQTEEEKKAMEDHVTPDQLVWVVYSRNPAFGAPGAVDLPYLAHFIAMDGTCLRSSAVTVPGDPTVQAGYSAAYAFEFMEKKEWSGKVTMPNGEETALTVPVMRDTRTGIWYLADPERKIAVGNYYPLAYEEENVSLAASLENEGWNEQDLITYAHMLRIWDFYAARGWIGADGQGTPILLLRGLCSEEKTPMDNAGYMGLGKGWQCFGYGNVSKISEALDVMAHEYTHCVTTAAMNTNLYQDDMGAINEAMSDIMGNLLEKILVPEEETEWLIGEDVNMVVRSMMHPHDKEQAKRLSTFAARTSVRRAEP